MQYQGDKKEGDRKEAEWQGSRKGRRDLAIYKGKRTVAGSKEAVEEERKGNRVGGRKVCRETEREGGWDGRRDLAMEGRRTVAGRKAGRRDGSRLGDREEGRSRETPEGCSGHLRMKKAGRELL